MTDLTKVRLPRVGTGNVTWQDLEPYLALVVREVLAPASLTQAAADALYPSQSAATVADVAGGVTVDTECRAQLNALLAALRASNVIDT